MKNIPSLIAVLAGLNILQSSFGYNSIIIKDGYDIDPRLNVRQGADSSFNIAKSEHFIIKTTLANPAAQDMVRHLEVWHSQILNILPRASEIFAEKRGQQVTMHVFAMREQKSRFYKLPIEKVGVDTWGIICENAGDKLNIPVTSLQHECYHYWNDIYMGKPQPGAWEEGGSDFIGMWNIDKSQSYNLGGENYKEGWALIEKLKNNQGTWMTYEQIANNVTPPGGEIYAQGWLLYHFLLNSPIGKKHGDVLFTSYQTDRKAQKIQGTQRNFYRSNADKNIYSPQYLQAVERDWKDYVRTMKKPSAEE